MRGPRETYTHGHAESVLRSHVWRTVDNSAAYLAEHLRPGLQVLDVGCGPGTITVEMENFMRYVFDVCRSFVRQGHTRVVMVNGHGSNAALCALVARRIVNETEDALAAAINHWDLARDLAARIRETRLRRARREGPPPKPS